MDCSPPDSSVHAILQARILGRVAIPSPVDLPDLGVEHASPGAPALRSRDYYLPFLSPSLFSLSSVGNYFYRYFFFLRPLIYLDMYILVTFPNA